MDTSNEEKTGVKFRVLFSYDSLRNRHIHYLILLNENLIVVERRTLDERSELILKNCYENVVDYKVMDEDSSGRPTVSIYKLDGSQLSASFSSDSQPQVNTLPDNELVKQSTILTHHLQMQKSLHQKVLREMGDKLKFGPPIDDKPNSEILVRYGDPWKRIHNDQLVIGVPILNASVR